MNIKVYPIVLIITILYFLMCNLLSFLVIWNLAKKDIKEYLNDKEK